MSNPLRTVNTPLETALANLGVNDAYYDGADAKNKEARMRFDLTKTAQMLSKKVGIVLAPSLKMDKAVAAGLVYNEGARERLLALAPNMPMQFRLRTLKATQTKNRIVGSTTPYGIERDSWGRLTSKGDLSGLDDRVAVETAALNKFRVGAGTAFSMHRLEFAVPNKGSTLSLQPVTCDEADAAYYACGMFHGSTKTGKSWDNTGPTPDAYKSLWPLVREEGTGNAAVYITKDASLGLPYSTKGRDEEALHSCLGVTKFLMHSWRNNAAAHYRLAMEQKPSLVTFQGKTKGDLYTREKIDKLMLRFYTVMPGHLKLLLARATQPFGKAKRTLFDVIDAGHDVENFHSAQKIGMTQDGPQYILKSLECQMQANGYAYLHCGDDAIFSYAYAHQGVTRVVMFKIDASNYDLTQRYDTTSEIDDRLALGMAEIDSNMAGLWKAIFAERLVNIHMSGVVRMSGIGASGLPLQSEKNDMLMDVYCQRVAEQLESTSTAHGSLLDNEMPVYCTTPVGMDGIIGRVATGLGLKVRIENMVSSDILVSGDNVVFETISESCPEGFPFLGYRIVPATKLMTQETGPLVTAIGQVDRFAVTMQYPNKTWVKDREEFNCYDEQRIASTVLALGGHAHTSWAGTREALDETIFMSLKIQRLEKKVAKTEEDVFFEGGEETLPVNLVEFKKLSARLFSPLEKQSRRGPMELAVENLESILAQQDVSWADIDDNYDLLTGEEWLHDVSEPRAIKNLPLGLRQVTQQNWGRPPPERPERVNLSSIAAPGNQPGKGSKKTQKRRAKRAKRGAEGFDEESTQRHFAQQREEEEERMDVERAKTGRRRRLSDDR